MALNVLAVSDVPGVLENRRKWGEHNWQHGGHRWSPGGTRAGTDMMWWRSIRPRIHAWLPTGSLLEIAPGTGRWTAYLLDECEHLTAVDITPECVEACRGRFAHVPHAEFHVNDGQTLPAIANASLDFAFSLDSLVHVEAPQLREYLGELARTLKPGGAAFLHHSNLGAYVESRTTRVATYVRERHWRAESVSAKVFRDACRDAGLECPTQELVNWIGRDGQVDRHRLPSRHVPLTDCFSICVRPLDGGRRATTVYLNRGFVDEWRSLIALAPLYTREEAGRTDPADGNRTVPSPSAPGARPGWRARLRARANGYVVAACDPFLRALGSARCPDCGRRAARRDEGFACDPCQAVFRTH
jgi:SAM-dependent methyltransferase